MIISRSFAPQVYRAGRLLLRVAAIGLFAACVPVQASPSAATYEATPVVAWFDLSTELVKETPGFTPPVAARVFGYLGVALYETVQPGMPGYQTLAGQLNELEAMPRPDPLARYNWLLAANSALATTMRWHFPTTSPENLAAIDTLEQQIAREYGRHVDAVTAERSVAWGSAVADAIHNWSISDGGHEGYARNFPEGYEAPSGRGLWVSTPPRYSRAMLPYRGGNRPFAVADPEACPAPPPPDFSNQPHTPFYAEALEVYETVRHATPEQTEIARFWADNPGETSTPPGHWISITGQVLTERAQSLDVAAETYAKMGVVLADSFIVCWRTKYIYNLIRPVTYIQLVIDAGWNTPEITNPVPTPPFPEYTSGHSVQSSAAATVLTSLFGDGYHFVDHTHDTLGLAPRAYSSFQAAAEEAAISRLYGGIHYRSAIEQGLAQGRCVASKVLGLKVQQ